MEKFKDFHGCKVGEMGTIIGISGRVLKPIESRRRAFCGFDHRVKIKIEDGKYVLKRIHRLVWEVFRGPIPEGMQINHKDRDTTNNRLDNLEMVTPSQNAKHWRENEKEKKRLQGKCP